MLAMKLDRVETIVIIGLGIALILVGLARHFALIGLARSPDLRLTSSSIGTRIEKVPERKRPPLADLSRIWISRRQPLHASAQTKRPPLDSG
jgi:hypothetical protein